MRESDELWPHHPSLSGVKSLYNFLRLQRRRLWRRSSSRMMRQYHLAGERETKAFQYLILCQRLAIGRRSICLPHRLGHTSRQLAQEMAGPLEATATAFPTAL